MANYPNAVTGYYWKIKQDAPLGVRYILASCVRENRVKYPELGFNFSSQVPMSATGRFLCFLSKDDANKFIAKYLDSTCTAFRSRNTDDVIYRIDNGKSIVPCYSGGVAINNAAYGQNEPNNGGYSPRFAIVKNSKPVENPFEANSDETIRHKERVANSNRLFDCYKKVFTRLAGSVKTGQNCYGDYVEAELPVPGMNYKLSIFVAMNPESGVMRIEPSSGRGYILAKDISITYGESRNDKKYSYSKEFTFTPISRGVRISSAVDDLAVLISYTDNSIVELSTDYFLKNYRPIIFRITPKDDEATVEKRLLSELDAFGKVTSSIVSQLRVNYGNEQLSKDMF